MLRVQCIQQCWKYDCSIRAFENCAITANITWYHNHSNIFFLSSPTFSTANGLTYIWLHYLLEMYNFYMCKIQNFTVENLFYKFSFIDCIILLWTCKELVDYTSVYCVCYMYMQLCSCYKHAALQHVSPIWHA